MKFTLNNVPTHEMFWLEKTVYIGIYPRIDCVSLEKTAEANEDKLVGDYNIFEVELKHEHFNPYGNKFYAQLYKKESGKICDLRAELYTFTGTLNFIKGTCTMQDGLYHDASGKVAVVEKIHRKDKVVFPPYCYYLHGKKMKKPIEYFTFLEKNMNMYPEYDPLRFQEYLNNTKKLRNE